MSVIDFITQNIPTVLALAATGVFAGLLAGLLGVGGDIVIVPVLFFLFQSFDVSPDTAMVIATATSLATIVPTSISSIRAHHQKGNVDFDLLKRWAPFILLGVLAGSWLVTRVDGRWLTGLFGVIATLSALNMLFRTGKAALYEQLPGTPGQTAMGTGIGFFSAMVGIGGGTLSVPLLTLGNTPADAPAGTIGLVNLIGFLCIVPLTVLFAPLGAALAAKLGAAKLKKIFAVVLLITGLRMLVQGVL